jgi:hypothetical protein
MAFNKVDYVYIILVTILFILQLYLFMIKHRDTLLTVTIPVALVFLFIIGVKRMFKKSYTSDLPEDEEETTAGETSFRVMFIILNFVTLLLFMYYAKNIPSILDRQLNLGDNVSFVEIAPNEFALKPVQYIPVGKTIVPKRATLGSIGKSKDTGNSSTPDEFEIDGNIYKKLQPAVLPNSRFNNIPNGPNGPTYETATHN